MYLFSAAAAAKSLQSCPTLCDPIDGSPPGSPIPGILQARTPEWVAISFSSAWKWKVKVKSLSRVRLLATPWTAAHQAPPCMGFSRQEYWSGVPLPSPHFSKFPEEKHSDNYPTHHNVLFFPLSKMMLTPWKESYDQPRQHIKKQRHYFANKGLSSQSYGFSSSHVWMWELDHKESCCYCC